MLEREVVGHGHGRIEPEVVVAFEEACVRLELVGAEVRHGDAQSGVRAQEGLDALGAAGRVRIDGIGCAAWLTARVHHERLIGRHARIVHVVEKRIVDGEPLHVAVELHPAEPARESLTHDQPASGSPGNTVATPVTSGRPATTAMNAFSDRAIPGTMCVCSATIRPTPRCSMKSRTWRTPSACAGWASRARRTTLDRPEQAVWEHVHVRVHDEGEVGFDLRTVHVIERGQGPM